MTIRPEYIIYASWGPRAEPPESIAARYLACADRLKQIHPAYDNWIFDFNGKPKKFDALRDDLAAAVAANVSRAENGNPEPIYGYWPSVTNTMKKSHSRSLSLTVNAGSWVNDGYFCNSAEIKTGNRVVPDPSIIAYPAFKAALLALVESFDATYCSAFPMQIRDFWDPKPPSPHRLDELCSAALRAPRHAAALRHRRAHRARRPVDGGNGRDFSGGQSRPSRRGRRHPQSPRPVRGASLAARRHAGMTNG